MVQGRSRFFFGVATRPAAGKSRGMCAWIEVSGLHQSPRPTVEIALLVPRYVWEEQEQPLRRHGNWPSRQASGSHISVHQERAMLKLIAKRSLPAGMISPKELSC